MENGISVFDTFQLAGLFSQIKRVEASSFLLHVSKLSSLLT